MNDRRRKGAQGHAFKASMNATPKPEATAEARKGESELDKGEVDPEQLFRQAEEDEAMDESAKRDIAALRGAEEAEPEQVRTKKTRAGIQQTSATDILCEATARQQEAAKANEKTYSSVSAETAIGCTGLPASCSGTSREERGLPDAAGSKEGAGSSAFEGTAERAAWEDPERCG